MTHRYVNQWHKPGRPEYGPETYETNSPAESYRDFDIHWRLDEVWDVVKDGVCVGQFAGPNGARQSIDHHLDGTGHSFLSIPEAASPAPSLPRP